MSMTPSLRVFGHKATVTDSPSFGIEDGLVVPLNSPRLFFKNTGQYSVTVTLDLVYSFEAMGGTDELTEGVHEARLIDVVLEAGEMSDVMDLPLRDIGPTKGFPSVTHVATITLVNPDDTLPANAASIVHSFLSGGEYVHGKRPSTRILAR